MLDKFLAWFGYYWYEFKYRRVHAFYLEEARAKLQFHDQELIDTNDTSIV